MRWSPHIILATFTLHLYILDDKKECSVMILHWSPFRRGCLLILHIFCLEIWQKEGRFSWKCIDDPSNENLPQEKQGKSIKLIFWKMTRVTRVPRRPRVLQRSYKDLQRTSMCLQGESQEPSMILQGASQDSSRNLAETSQELPRTSEEPSKSSNLMSYANTNSQKG